MQAGMLAPQRGGFTLVELIVAAVVGVLIAGATATAISQLLRARAASAAHQQAFARAEAGAARMALDVTNSVRNIEPYFQRVAIVNGGLPGQERDELLVLMRSLRPLRGIEGSPEGDEYEAQYRVVSTQGTPALWRRVDAAHDLALDGGGIATATVSSVAALSLEATDGIDWFEEWDSDSDGMPHAVRIVVVGQSDDGRVKATARRVVALDRVPILPEELQVESEEEEPEPGTSGGAP